MPVFLLPASAFAAHIVLGAVVGWGIGKTLNRISAARHAAKMEAQKPVRRKVAPKK